MAEKYSDKLKDPKWQKKRLEILQRDEWMCQSCYDNENTLHVHHRRYLSNVEPWDYPNELLITLCENCHNLENEKIKGVCDDLIGAIKDKFLADDIKRITDGFLKLHLVHAPEVVATIIEWTLSNNDIQYELKERFFIDMHERLHKDKK